MCQIKRSAKIYKWLCHPVYALSLPKISDFVKKINLALEGFGT